MEVDLGAYYIITKSLKYYFNVYKLPVLCDLVNLHLVLIYYANKLTSEILVHFLVLKVVT